MLRAIRHKGRNLLQKRLKPFPCGLPRERFGKRKPFLIDGIACLHNSLECADHFAHAKPGERQRPARPNDRNRGQPQGQGGQWARGNQAAGRIAVSESLSRSALVKRAGGVMPLREAVLVVALINHPSLVDENFDQIEQLEFSHSELKGLHAALINAHAHGEATDHAASIEAIKTAGLSDAWDRATGLVRKARFWPALEDAALDDAREAFNQALHLQRSAGALHKELKAAEAALATDPTDENYRHLVEIQAQFRDVQAPEALIDGFGVLSGRAARSF